MLYVLGKSLISDFPYLERDIRALSPEIAVLEAGATNLAPEIHILEKNNLSELSQYGEIILSNDDVSKEFADKYLKGKNIIWDTTFLRWNRMNAVRSAPALPNKTISSSKFDQKMMNLAYNEANKSSDWWRHVGAVLVKNDKVVFVIHNRHAVTDNTAYIEGEPRSNFDAGKDIADLVIFEHTEATMIANAAKQGISTLGAEIYVTTFPCPSCAMSIANAGVSKVYYKEGYSLLDAERILKNAGVELIFVS